MTRRKFWAEFATLRRGVSPAVVSHYAVQPVLDIFATNNERDLGAVSVDIQRIVDDSAKAAPAGSSVVLRGQTATMNSAYTELYEGLALAIVLIYLTIVVNFQSWLDPFVIVSALPAALAGIVWMLFVTRTALSVPALTGAIMATGVATANSILVVSFARARMSMGADAFTAAIEAGFTRFRPVLMTALAMVIGMAPMALSAQQNAPLGRAVIGGLICSTIATLFFVPAVLRWSTDTTSAPRMAMGQTSNSRRSHKSRQRGRTCGGERFSAKSAPLGRLIIRPGWAIICLGAEGVAVRRKLDALNVDRLTQCV